MNNYKKYQKIEKENIELKIKLKKVLNSVVKEVRCLDSLIPNIDYKELSKEELLDMLEGIDFRDYFINSLDYTDLSVRVKNCLRAANIQTIQELIDTDETRLRRYRNMGEGCITEIKQFIEARGLKEKEEIYKTR